MQRLAVLLLLIPTLKWCILKGVDDCISALCELQQNLNEELLDWSEKVSTKTDMNVETLIRVTL